MSIIEGFSSWLATEIAEWIKCAPHGHCLRVDHLTRSEAYSVCKMVRAECDGCSSDIYVLGEDDANSDLTISPERAIELRNRKTSAVCLLVPAGLVDAAASSVSNSFASFDLQAAFQIIADKMVRQLPEELRQLSEHLAARFRTRRLPKEPLCDYFSAVLRGCESDPRTARIAGINLWRVGLVPDLAPDGLDGLVGRLARNEGCVRELAAPRSLQTTLSQKLDGLGLEPGRVRDALHGFLERERLTEPHTWLRRLADDAYLGDLSFDQWPFRDAEKLDVVAVNVIPFTDKNGAVQRYSRLVQPEGPRGPLYARPGSKVTIKWATEPETAVVPKWRISLLPSRDFYSEEEAAGIELTVKVSKTRGRQASLLIDVDLEDLEFRVVQVCVTALDEYGTEIRDDEGRAIEGFSEQFWLSEDVVTETSGKGRLETVMSIPAGRLRFVCSSSAEAVEEQRPNWTERDMHYFSVTLCDRQVCRIGISGILRELEKKVLADPESLGALSAKVDAGTRLSVDDIRCSGTDVPGAGDAWQRFLSKRKQLFRQIQRQEQRGLVETAEWTDELSSAARSYAESYRDLHLGATGPREAAAVLSIDTLFLDLVSDRGHEKVAIVMPTHPLRLLWFSSYTDLLRSWERVLCETRSSDRKTLVDVALIERLMPQNCPPIVTDRTGQAYLFAQNLRMFWGVAVPSSAKDPSRYVAEAARVLGYEEDEASLADLPPQKLADELSAYCRVHRYLKTMRLNVINPGGGGFLSEGLRAWYLRGTSAEDDESTDQELPNLELLVHCQDPVPTQLPALADLQGDIYHKAGSVSTHHLAPRCSLALRSVDELQSLPGGDVNISLAVDQLCPSVSSFEPVGEGDSSSFYALIIRPLPSFALQDGIVRWEHRVNLPVDTRRERHPAFARYTEQLVDTHRAYLRSCSLALGFDSEHVPGVVVELLPDDRMMLERLHTQSDWVVTLDRFLGVEFYDDPRDPELGSITRKYLLDYSPEFLEGIGHRMLVTTAHRAEVEEILARAMKDLGFELVEGSVGEVLHHLKLISGRLALRVVGDETRAKEAVSLGAVSAYLRAHDELSDSILIPVDAHPELFAPQSRTISDRPRERCDLIRIRFRGGKVEAAFIEVKSRSSGSSTEELFNRIADQIDATVDVTRDLFFRQERPRLDHSLQRSRLASILRFYLRRAERYGAVSASKAKELDASLDTLGVAYSDMRVERLGFIVDLNGSPQKAVRVRGTEIRFLTAEDFLSCNLYSQHSLLPAIERSQSVVEPEPSHWEISHEVPTPVGVTSKRPEKRPRDETPGQVAGGIDIELGTTVGEQQRICWQPSVKGSPHLFILGIPGQGKSVTITNLLRQCAEQGLPALIIDFHGQFGRGDNPYARFAEPAVVDASEGLPFSPLEADTARSAGTSYWQTNCFEVAEIIAYVCGLGDIQRYVVYEAIKDSYLSCKFDDERPIGIPSVRDVAERIAEIEQDRGVRNVTPRCAPLLEFRLFADQPRERWDLRTALRRGLVVDLHSLSLETLQLAAGAFLLRKVYKDMFHWGESQELRLAIVLDEAHRLARDITLPKIMKEGRKFGVAVVAASQGLGDFHHEVVANAGTKVIFRTNFPTSKKVTGFLRAEKGVDIVSAVEQLAVGEAFVQTPEMQYAARTRMHPLVCDFDEDASDQS